MTSTDTPKRPFGTGWFRNDTGNFYLYDRSLFFLIPIIVFVSLLLGFE